MSKRDRDLVSFNIHMIRHYVNELAAYKESGGTFTSDEVDIIDNVADKINYLYDSTPNTSGPAKAGGNPPKA